MIGATYLSKLDHLDARSVASIGILRFWLGVDCCLDQPCSMKIRLPRQDKNVEESNPNKYRAFRTSHRRNLRIMDTFSKFYSLSEELLTVIANELIIETHMETLRSSK